MNPRNRKLRLSKSTLRDLTAGESAHIQGGAVTTDTRTADGATCCEIQPKPYTEGWLCTFGCTNDCSHNDSCKTRAFTNCMC